jgi:hypothetical protein
MNVNQFDNADIEDIMDVQCMERSKIGLIAVSGII